MERRARYLKLAKEAKELAGRSRSLQMREACLGMAQSWLSLASDVTGADDAFSNEPAIGRSAPRLDPAESQVALAAPAAEAGLADGSTWNGEAVDGEAEAEAQTLSCEPSRREG